MESNIAMYSMKPILHLTTEITLPTCMYKMRNLHNQDYPNSSQEIVVNNDGLEGIEKRQKIMLQKLEQIKNVLATLKNELSVPKIDSSIIAMQKPNFSEFGITHDVVLNLSIKKPKPPYSLLVINKVWPEIVINYSCHLHSSASSLPAMFESFQKKLQNKSNDDAADLYIRVVWKEVDTDCEFVISPLKSVPLIGEVSFLRFLFISFNSSYDPILQTLLDEKLDACHCLTQCKSIDSMKPYLQILSNGLDKNTWQCGEQISVVDIAAWSVLKQLEKNNFGINSLNNWFNRCNNYFDTKK